MNEEPTIIETEVTCSDNLAELFAAMAKAQGEITDAEKDSTNPFFKSKYADLASVRSACMPALSKNGLCIIQLPFASGKLVAVITILGHSSGQFIRTKLTLAAKGDDVQSVGSTIAYGRRYSLSAVAVVAAADEDDDGNGAVRPQPPQPSRSMVIPGPATRPTVLKPQPTAKE